jgi:hypothetical protein
MTNRRAFMRGAGALAATVPLAEFARASTENLEKVRVNQELVSKL